MSGCVVVFGREPVPGKVKSRLAAALGAAGAARAYAALLDHTLDVATHSGARVVLSLADTPSGVWTPPPGLVVEVQRGLGLGDRLDDVFGRRFAEGERQVVVVGSDCPWILPRHITTAATRLAAVDAVFGPAADGGYWLVAQRPPGLALFEGVPWSAPETLEHTRKRVVALGGTWSELDVLVDIDTIDDLELALADPRTTEKLRATLRSIHAQSIQR